MGKLMKTGLEIAVATSRDFGLPELGLLSNLKCNYVAIVEGFDNDRNDPDLFPRSLNHLEIQTMSQC